MLLPLPRLPAPQDRGTLDNLRSTFLAFVASTWLLWVPLGTLALSVNEVPEIGLEMGLVALYALASLGGLAWARSQPLQGTTPDELRDSYQANLFLKLGFAMGPAVAGLVGSFLADSLVPYLVGFLLSQACFLVLAPSRWDVERRQQELRSRGSLQSLLDALS